MYHILLVASRKTTIDSLREILERDDFFLSVASNQRLALRNARLHAPDLVIIDNTSRLSGPKLSLELKRIREMPIIAIVRDEDEVAPMGATLGLVKPYTARQLIESIYEVLAFPRQLVVGPLRLDVRAQTVQVPHRDEPQVLSPKLFALLKLLLEAQGEVVRRATLMAEVWNTAFMGDTRTLDVHIRWLRRIIEPNPGKPKYLLTVRGEGYRITYPSGQENTQHLDEELESQNTK